MGLIDRKQRAFERREEDILDAALALFSRPGWESVTIEQIAREAEVGKGTVYKHFSSKDELLFHLMLRFYRGLLARLQPVFMSAAVMPDIFADLIREAFEYHLENREYRYIVEYCNSMNFKERADASWRESFLQLDATFDQWATPLLEKAMDEGVIEQRPSNEIHIGSSACFHGAISMLWAGRDWCIEDEKDVIISATTAFILSGLVGQPNK